VSSTTKSNIKVYWLNLSYTQILSWVNLCQNTFFLVNYSFSRTHLQSLQIYIFLKRQIYVNPRHNFVKRVCSNIRPLNHFPVIKPKTKVVWTELRNQLWKIDAAAWGIMASQSENSMNTASADSLPVCGCSSGGENFTVLQCL